MDTFKSTNGHFSNVNIGQIVENKIRFLIKLVFRNYKIIIVQSIKTFSRTLDDLDKLANSEFMKGKKFDDFSVADLKKIKSEDYRHLCTKKIEEFSNQYLKTREKLLNEEVVRFEQSEVKNLTNALTNLRDQCEKYGLSVKEFEEESVKFITDKYKRFFFNFKWAQRLY